MNNFSVNKRVYYAAKIVILNELIRTKNGKPFLRLSVFCCLTIANKYFRLDCWETRCFMVYLCYIAEK